MRFAILLVCLAACSEDTPPPKPHFIKKAAAAEADEVKATMEGALSASSKLPDWAKVESVHEETRQGKRMHVAVASATMDNVALARDAAANRARAAIVRLRQGQPAGAAAGVLEGSRIARTYNAGQTVIVEVEAEVP